MLSCKHKKDAVGGGQWHLDKTSQSRPFVWKLENSQHFCCMKFVMKLPILEGNRLGSTDHAVLKAYPSTKALAYPPPGVFMLGLVASSKNDVSRIRVKKQKDLVQKSSGTGNRGSRPFSIDVTNSQASS